MPENELGPCQLWQGQIFQVTGYGKAAAAQRRVSGEIMAHRHVWAMRHGPIPEGKRICHHCDVRPCVNPDHLFVGTHADNMKDMAAKGRHPSTLYPELRKGPKLTPEQIREIRSRFIPAVHIRSNAWDLAAEFGVSKQAIINAATGVTWANVD